MAVFRSYFSEQSGLIYNSLANTSRNEVMELAYGNAPLPIQASGGTTFSRYIFKPDLQTLKDYMLSGNIPTPYKHVLRMYNTIALIPDERGRYAPDGSRRAYGFTLKVYRLAESFTEGVGHDYIYPNVISPDTAGEGLYESNNTSPNWFWRNAMQQWSNPGAIDHNDSFLVGEQHFPLGTEDLEIDITSEVVLLLGNSIQNNGYCIAFEPDLEAKEDNEINKVHFFSKYTQTFFEPHIESYLLDSAVDSRDIPNSIVLDEGNYVYIQSDCQPMEGILYDHCGNGISVFTASTQIQKNLYRYYLGIFDSDTYPTLVNFDFRYNCIGKKECYIDLTTYPSSCGYNGFTGVSDDISIIPSNLSYGETLPRSGMRKVLLDIKSFNGYKKYIPVQYRILAMQGRNAIVVQDWESASRIGMKYWIWLYPEWMLPKEYILEFAVKENELFMDSTHRHRFFIASEKKSGYR